MTCSIDGCDRKRVARGWCAMHWQRWRKTGDPGPAEKMSRAGAGNSRWSGGRVRGGHQARYWMRHAPDHPKANGVGYVLEHRLIVEAQLGRYLRDDEIVHHVNGDPADNRPENLAVMSQSEHVSLHAARRREDGRGGWRCELASKAAS